MNKKLIILVAIVGVISISAVQESNAVDEGKTGLTKRGIYGNTYGIEHSHNGYGGAQGWGWDDHRSHSGYGQGHGSIYGWVWGQGTPKYRGNVGNGWGWAQSSPAVGNGWGWNGLSYGNVGYGHGDSSHHGHGHGHGYGLVYNNGYHG